MGFLDFFGGGSGPEKVAKLKAKATQRYGDPGARQKAITQLGELKTPEAVSALMSRFTISVDPQTLDADEKDHVFELIRGLGSDAVAPVKDFLRKSDQASSWALKVLLSVLPETEVVGIAVENLERLANEYARDPEKKVVLLHFVEEKDDPRCAPAAVPFVEDHSDDVKIAALRVLGKAKHEPGREPILKLLTGEETAKRVRSAAIVALHEGELGVQGFREKVEALLEDPYFLDKSGLIKKRG